MLKRTRTCLTLFSIIFCHINCGENNTIKSEEDENSIKNKPGTLVTTEIVPNLSKCLGPGKIVSYGIDADLDGILSGDEIQEKFSVCDKNQPDTVIRDSLDVIVTEMMTTTKMLGKGDYIWDIGKDISGIYNVYSSEFSDLEYESTNCAGTAYVFAVNPRETFQLPKRVGVGSDPAFYSLKDETEYFQITSRSWKGFSGTCYNYSSSSMYYVANTSNLVVVEKPSTFPGTPPYHYSKF